MRANITRTRRARCSTSATTAPGAFYLACSGRCKPRSTTSTAHCSRSRRRIGDWRRPIDRCSSSPWAVLRAMFELSRAGDSGRNDRARRGSRRHDSASIRGGAFEQSEEVRFAVRIARAALG